jgi:hypothetical protein
MCISPRAQAGVLSHVFIANIQATDKGGLSIHNDDFAMIAKIDLKAIGRSLCSFKARHLNACGFQIAKIGIGQGVAADFVIQKENGNIAFCFLDQTEFYFTAQAVILDDEELKQDVGLRRFDGFENTGHDLLTVYEQLHAIALGEGHFDELSQRVKVAQLLIEVSVVPRLVVFFNLSQDIFEVLGGAALQGFEIALKLISPKQPIEWESKIRESEQGDDPGNGALRRSGAHDGVEDAENGEEVTKDDEADEEGLEGDSHVAE